MRRFAALLAIALATPVAAQVCDRPILLPGFAGWGQRPQPQLAIGGYSELAMAPAGVVKFSPPLVHAPAPGSRGGVYALRPETPGTYRFALGAEAGIDVIDSRGQRVPPISSRRGPACSGMARIIDYALADAEYVVQFSAVGAPALRVMIGR